jgi:hypothetical protein
MPHSGRRRHSLVFVCQKARIDSFPVVLALQDFGQLLAPFCGIPSRFASVCPVLSVGAGNCCACHHLIGPGGGRLVSFGFGFGTGVL